MRFPNFPLILFGFVLITSSTSVQPTRQVKVISHPDGPLYVGDQVSFEVLSPNVTGETTGSITVMFGDTELGHGSVTPYGIGERNQATIWWVWDTSNLKPGNYNLTFTSMPENMSWSEIYSLRPADQVPLPEPEAHWDLKTTVCCNIYYITHTSAERDITIISQEADNQSAIVSAQMGSSLSTRMDVIIVSRLIGHGGFTSKEIYLSYLDDNYIGNDLSILLHHEFVHYYDGVLGGVYLPAVLQEGLAVYLVGGHFKPEQLGPRAAALLDLGWYIPLSTITDNFYIQQHEICYLEAGALVQYLVETYGWDAFTEFYRTIPALENRTNSVVLDIAMYEHFGISFADLEKSYLAYLRSQVSTEVARTDLQLTVSFFDTVRRYQEVLDPSAYFLTAWLPDGVVMRQRGIVADFLRHPADLENHLFESLLNWSNRELFSRNYQNTLGILKLTNWLLNLINP
jgi:hypothetical protein